MSDETGPAAPAPTLLGPAEIRDLAELLGVAPTKKLGQNFVIDANTVRRIVRVARVESGTHVVEVGPGLGSLTLGLLETGASVVAVEIDGRLAEQLPITVGLYQPDADLTVVQFSTAFCGPCRATRARLQQLQTTRPGLAYLHVDAESHLDAVRALDVRRTPTLFYLDRTGALLGRSSGAPRPDELTALVDAHAGVSR